MHLEDGMLARGMSLKVLLLIVLLLVPFLLSGLAFSQPANVEDVHINERHLTMDNAVLVAGDFHYFDVTLSLKAEKICIIAYAADSLPECEDRSVANYYRWEYNHGVWKDISGHDSLYLLPSKCVRENDTYSFYLAIDQKANPGHWTIKILVDDTEVSSTSSIVIIAGFNVFLSAMICVFEPSIRDKRFLVDREFVCSDRKRLLAESGKDIDALVDTVLKLHNPSTREEDSSDVTPDSFLVNDKSLLKDELAQSTVSTYHRSKLKQEQHTVASSLIFNKKWGGGNGFWTVGLDGYEKFLAVILSFVLLSVAFVPIISSANGDDDPPDITIINVQSYPVVGGKWTVMFATVGRANLTITAVNGTTWSNSDNDYDLRFLELRCGNETLEYEWVDESVFIENYSCDETCYEISKVLTSGKHHLEFDFGGIKAYAHNSADQDFKIQRGSTLIAAGDTNATITAGTDYDAPTGEAFIRIVSTRLSGGGYTGGGGTQPPDHHMVTINNPENIGTSITFERSASDPTWNTYFEWEIIEYVGSAGDVNEIKVRNASTITVGGASATTGMISGIVDDSDIVVFITGQRTDGSASGNVDRGLHTAQWNSVGDTATFTRGDSNNNGYVSYAVVEFTGSNWKIQRVTHQQTAAGPQTENPGTQLEDINKTFLHVQTRTNSGNLDEQGVETWISSTTQLSFERDSLATATQNVVAWVIENNQTYSTPMSVEHISGSRGTGGPEPDIYTETITTVNAMTSSLTINATASDTGGIGVKNVTLYWYNSTDNSTWSGPWNFGTDTVSPWSWNFNFPNGTGYYRFYSIAADNASNTESFSGNDTECGYDTTAPSSQVDNITPYWHNASDNPLNITETNPSDDLSGVKNITLYYRYRADNGSSWGSWNFSTACGYDTVKPSSQVDSLSQYWYNEPDNPLAINVTSATDSLSGVKNVSLYYRYRIDNGSSWNSWEYFDIDTNAPWTWDFNFPNSKGHYQFYSIAADNASNYENPPVSPDNDTECGYNTTKPYSEVDDILPYWHNSSPLTITAQATDFSGSGLDNVTLYCYNSSDNIVWSDPWIFGVVTDPWIGISWSFNFPNGTGYYRFYSIAIDNNSNIEDFTGNDTSCGYDTAKPSSQVDVISPYWHNASDNPLNITETNPSDDLSGVKNITLYYRYRADNGSSWGSWNFSRT